MAVVLSNVVSAASPPWLTANDDKIKAIVEKMTLAEKVGQMTQPDSGSVKDLDDITTLALGSMLSGGSSDPESGNKLSDWAEFYTERQKRALKSRLGIPLIYGVDAVHGHSNLLGAVIFPHNIGLGCTRNPELVEEIARITAREVRASGIQWTFAPSVAVPRDIRWGRTYEGFSEDPAVVALLGADCKGRIFPERNRSRLAPNTSSVTGEPNLSRGEERACSIRAMSASTRPL